MFLLDANVVIEAADSFYELSRVPEYWEWLEAQIHGGSVRVPTEVWDEITTKDDDLLDWLKKQKSDAVLDPGLYDSHLGLVLDRYGENLLESELETMGADPYLIAAAQVLNATVVTRERSKPKKKRGNRKIPDVCRELGVEVIDDHEFNRVLDFRTNWRS